MKNSIGEFMQKSLLFIPWFVMVILIVHIFQQRLEQKDLTINYLKLENKYLKIEIEALKEITKR